MGNAGAKAAAKVASSGRRSAPEAKAARAPGQVAVRFPSCGSHGVVLLSGLTKVYARASYFKVGSDCRARRFWRLGRRWKVVEQRLARRRPRP
eukprot:scaffold4195_cov250-Pinguiococcus_pyrenoidosus.AAC.2